MKHTDCRDPKANCTLLDDVMPGDCFLWHGELCMKPLQHGSSDRDAPLYVNLTDGCLYTVADSHEVSVEVVEAEIHIVDPPE